MAADLTDSDSERLEAAKRIFGEVAGILKPQDPPSEFSTGKVNVLLALAALQREGRGGDPNVDLQSILDKLGVDVDTPSGSGIRPKSRLIPSFPHDNIDVFHDIRTKELVLLRDRSHYDQDNLHPGLSEALSTLQHYPTITIKPSDKGGNVVVMDVAIYEQALMRQLSQVECYEVITPEMYKTEANTFQNWLVEWMDRGVLDDDE
ncbi:hypothetical protein NDU88_002436 [Pleurodeles waltl]|uniref:Uncharacterized protein n=1 Tax=Pleurodeles waltl TaxID=8319 RepID=A0AAV7W1V4_PLEWA|nr:hypothetical protein NDU88_002436 [Pleurodeles waltl]